MNLLDSAINILDKHQFKISLFLFCFLVFLLYIVSKLVKFSNIEGKDVDEWEKEVSKGLSDSASNVTISEDGDCSPVTN